ncbi:MAG: hypothetical protein FWC41_12430 [Firmicutes bacterium]|nr:hypothetical protein [Bacillota bacterium]
MTTRGHNKVNANTPIIICVVSVLGLISALMFIIIGGGEPITRLVSQPLWFIALTYYVLPLTTSLCFFLITRVFSIEKGDKKIISEHSAGFKEISIDWNYKKPLKMLLICLPHGKLPKSLIDKSGEGLKKFKKVQIILDHSVKTFESRFESRPFSSESDRKKFYDKQILATEECLKAFMHYGLKNVQVSEIKSTQYPFGLMIQNGKHIFYIPLWNDTKTIEGAIVGDYLKVPSDSEIGELMIDSFDWLVGERKYSGDKSKLKNSGDKSKLKIDFSKDTLEVSNAIDNYIKELRVLHNVTEGTA